MYICVLWKIYQIYIYRASYQLSVLFISRTTCRVYIVCVFVCFYDYIFHQCIHSKYGIYKQELAAEMGFIHYLRV